MSKAFEQQEIDEMMGFFATPMATEDEDPEHSEYQKNTKDTSTKTKFRGVFVNTHKNKDKFKFRVAIAQEADRSTGVYWQNHGYFNDIDVAGLAYNTAALGIYTSKAKLNRTDLTNCDKAELEEFKKKRSWRVGIAGYVLGRMKAEGIAVTYID